MRHFILFGQRAGLQLGTRCHFFSFLWNGIGILNFRQYQRWLSKKSLSRTDSRLLHLLPPGQEEPPPQPAGTPARGEPHL